MAAHSYESVTDDKNLADCDSYSGLSRFTNGAVRLSLTFNAKIPLHFTLIRTSKSV
jgi:hypothetical protein